MDSHFEYRLVGKKLMNTLSTIVGRGESVALFGPRYVGKRYVMNKLEAELRRENISPLVSLHFLSDMPLCCRHALQKSIREATHQAAGAFLRGFENFDNAPENNSYDEYQGKSIAETEVESFDIEQTNEVYLLEPIVRLAARVGQPVVLFATNVDAMADHIARNFLQEIRSLVTEGKLYVVLSGEDDFQDLVYGPNSIFNPAYQFVLQGFERPSFSEVVGRHAKCFNINLDAMNGGMPALFDFTGGQTFLAQLIISSIVEQRALSGVDTMVPSLFEHNLQANLTTFSLLANSLEAGILRQSINLLSRKSDCWEILEQIIKHGEAPIAPGDHAPGPLEIAGVAVRRVDQQRLVVASPMMHNLLRRFYTDRHFADLYAQVGQWDKAFQKFQIVPPEQRLRPIGLHDRAELETTIDSLIAALYEKATEGTESLQKIFVDGCRLVLGYPAVLFFEKREQWEVVSEHSEQDVTAEILPQEVKTRLIMMLATARTLPPTRILSLHEPLKRFVVASELSGAKPDEKLAVAVLDPKKATVISGERLRLTNKLLRNYERAWEHATAVDRNKSRLNTVSRFFDILASIFEGLGSEVRDVRTTLERAADGLIEAGFDRVLISRVSPDGKYIRGEVGRSAKKQVDNHITSDGEELARLTDWPLSAPEADVQPWVIINNQNVVVADACNPRLISCKVNQEVVKKFDLKSFAIVPIAAKGANPVGTIHVEINGGVIPSQETIEHLVQFAGYLAIAIEQSDRVSLLQKSLDRLGDPVIIVDPMGRVHYANEPSKKLVPYVASDWHYFARSDVESGIELRDELGAFSKEFLDDKADRRVIPTPELKIAADWKGDLTIVSLSDLQGRTIGASLKLHDHRRFYRLLEAISRIAAASTTRDAMRAMLQAAAVLGHKWGRLFYVSESDPNVLRSEHSFNVTAEGKVDEYDGTSVLVRGRVVEEAWECLEDFKVYAKPEPRVFCWFPKKESRAIVRLESNVEAVNIKNRKWPSTLQKQPGDFWIDFPFGIGNTPLGKITIECPKELTAEQFESLRILARIASGLLNSFAQRDSKWRTDARTALSGLAHLLRGPVIDSRSELLRPYRRLETVIDSGAKVELAKINNLLQQTLDSLDQINLRVRDLLEYPDVRLEQRNIKELVSQRMTEFRSRAKAEKELPDLDSNSVDKVTVPQIRKIILEQQHQQEEVTINNHTLQAKYSNDIKMAVDVFLFTEILRELRRNAREMIPSEERLVIKITVQPFKDHTGNWTEISFKDNGPGVTEEFKSRIFDDLFTTRKANSGISRGSGLGLAFVRRVCEAHGGYVFERGQFGEGADFVMRFPAMAKLRAQRSTAPGT